MKFINHPKVENSKDFQAPSTPYKKLPVSVYQPESKIRHPIQLFKDMWRDLLASRELAWQLLIRDISAQYRQSFLGILWAFIPPIITAISLSLLQNTKVLNLGVTDIPYPVYVMFSMSLWQVFTDALNGTIGATRTARFMLSKIKVPAEGFVLSSIGNLIFNFGIQIILIIFLFIWFKVNVSWTVILAPVALTHLIIFGTAIGLFLGPLATIYGDIVKTITFIMRVWIFVTPVLYPMPKEGLWALLVRLNPVTPLLLTTRELVISGNISYPVEFWIASFIAFLGLFLGWIFYRLSLPILVERASS